MPHLEIAFSQTVSGWFAIPSIDCQDQPILGTPGNTAHHRPHHPQWLNAARKKVGELSQTVPAHWHLMGQVHGAEIGVITPDMPLGTFVRSVDALVTTVPNRTLGVFSADCLPVLISGSFSVAAIHAGRAGIEKRILTRTVARLTERGEDPAKLQVVIGPAIGGCCYELPHDLVTRFVAHTPAAAATTTWGTPALDLVSAAREELAGVRVNDVATVGICTACDPHWFSHRRDPNTGRAVALITRREANK